MLPGIGVTIDSLRTMQGKAPDPSRWVLCDVGGGGSDRGASACAAQRRMPELLGKVKRWTGTASKVIAIGFSRGGAWGLSLVLNHAADLDAAVLIAPYPSSDDDVKALEESRRLMLAPRPVLLIH